MSTNDNTTANATDYVVAEEIIDVDDRPQGTSAETVVTSGWAAAEALQSEQSEGFPTEFKHTEQPQIVKFLDQDGPFANFKQHFLNGKPGKKSYVCLNSKGGNDCPLCSVLKNKAEEKRAFSVVNFSAEGGPQRQIILATPRFYKSLHLAHFSPQGPLTKHYWAISRTGKMQTTVYHLQAIKARDLQEDWNINEANAEDVVSKSKVFESSLYKMNTYAELLEIAQELSADNN